MVKKFGIGQSAQRLEDVRFLTGHGNYTDDIREDGTAIGYVLRSAFAHAELGAIDTEAARAVEGVLAIYTAADIAGVLNDMPCEAPLRGRDGKPVAGPSRTILARDKVRYVGDPVAFVVAETLNAAKDAAELIDIEYEPLDAITDTARALSPDVPQVCDDAPDNLSLDWEVGDEAAVAAAFEGAAHVVKRRIINNRVIPNAMETRAAWASYSVEDGYTIHTVSQGVFGIKNSLIAAVEDADADNLRVVTGDVGGGFGMKGFSFHEYPLILMAARDLGRPVKWTGDRGEAFLNDTHGRDLVSDVAMALDADGRILSYRVDTIANFGAYLSQFAPFIPTMAAVQVLGGVYQVPSLYVNVKCVLSHTPPVDAYRGAGRPEAAYMLERMMNAAAFELGLDQDEIRRRNFIPADAMPYTTATSTTFDSGHFEETMDKAKALAGWDGFAARNEDAAARGRLRGIGMAYYIECTLGAPSEEVTLTFTDDGLVELAVGTQSNGQGHETTFAQIIADRLDVPFEAVKLVEGDTALKATGGGTGGSRSLQMIGNASLAVCDEVVERGKKLAAIVLEADEITFEDGLFQAPGTNKRIPVMELAEATRELDDLPEDLVGGLNSTAGYTKEASTFPNGCHIAEVEIDPETGNVDVVDYSVVDDFGIVINPMVVAGQVHGGVVQGIGQALTENCVYEDGSGQLLTGSFMDYGMPRADDMPYMKFEMNPVPCKTNPLGIKGCGEAGTIGACPSVMNAIVDALSARGVAHMDMPVTPEKVWHALNAQNRYSVSPIHCHSGPRAGVH